MHHSLGSAALWKTFPELLCEALGRDVITYDRLDFGHSDARTGLPSGLKVTTHHDDIKDLQDIYPTLSVVDSVRWVDEGKFVTSGGISAGIDMSLHLISKLSGLDLAEKTAAQMEFSWRKNA